MTQFRGRLGCGVGCSRHELSDTGTVTNSFMDSSSLSVPRAPVVTCILHLPLALPLQFLHLNIAPPFLSFFFSLLCSALIFLCPRDTPAPILPFLVALPFYKLFHLIYHPARCSSVWK